MTDKKYSIMIVDDEKFVLNSLSRVLKMQKQYEIITASSAREALALLAVHKVDVLISDQRMPDMQGVELLKKVKEEYPGIIRILLSGYSDFDGLAGAVNEGEIYRFVSKPWDNKELVSIVHNALRQKDLVSMISIAVSKVLRNIEESASVKIDTVNEAEKILVKVETDRRMFTGEELSNILTTFISYLSDRENFKGGHIDLNYVGGFIEKKQGKIRFTLNTKDGMDLTFEFLSAN